MNEFYLINSPLNAIAENYLIRKTSQLKPGQDKISNAQLATLYLRVKHGDISAPKLFLLKHFFRKDTWLNEAKGHVKQHNIQTAALSAGSRNDTQVSREAAKLLLLNEKHLDGTALYVPPSNIKPKEIAQIFHKFEKILIDRSKLKILIPVDSELRKDLDEIETINLNNIDKKSDAFNALFELALVRDSINSEGKIHLLKTLLNHYEEKLKTMKLENVNLIIKIYDSITQHCPGAETLPDHIITQSLPIIDPDSFNFLQEQLKLSNSGLLKETLIKDHRLSEAAFDKLFPKFHQTYLTLAKKGMPEATIQSRFNEYLSLRNSIAKEDFISEESKQKLIEGTFGPFLEKFLVEGNMESKIGPVKFLMKSIVAFHDKYKFFDESQLVRLALIHSRETLFNPSNNFLHKYDNDGKFDDILFERALLTKALEMEKTNPHYAEKCHKAWANDLIEALKNPYDLRNIMDRPIDPSIYIKTFAPLFVGPPNPEEIKALKNVIIAGEELLENDFDSNKEKSLPEIAQGCLSYLQEQKDKNQLVKGPDAYLDSGKAALLLPHCISYMTAMDQWEKSFTEGFEDNQQFMNLAFHIKTEFNLHREISGPLTAQELKNLQEIANSGLNLIKEDHYALESVGKGCFHFFAEQRKNQKLVKSPTSLTDKGKRDELLPFCYGHLLPFEGWDQKYLNSINEKYSKSSVDQKFASTLVNTMNARNLGPVNNHEFEMLEEVTVRGREFIHKNNYPQDVVAIGICLYFQELRDNHVSLQSPKSYEELTPYCFDALIEVGAGDKHDKLNDALFLFRKIKNRQLPLNSAGQQRLDSLLKISLDPAFALGKGLSDPMVKAKFRPMLQDLECADINSLNNHEYPLETLEKAFIEHQANLYQLMNFGDITSAMTENPTRCARELLQPVVTAVVGKGDQKAIHSINQNIDNLLNNLAHDKSSATLAAKMNSQFSKIAKAGPIAQALEMGIEISTKDLIKILLEEIEQIRSESPDEEPTGLIGILLSKLIPLFLAAQNERKDPNFSVFSLEASPLAVLFPSLHKAYLPMKAGGSIINALDFVSPKFITKIAINQIIPEITPKLINYGLKKQIKMTEKLIAEYRKTNPDADENPIIQGIEQQLDFMKILRVNSKEISVIGIKIATILANRHDINRHDPLLQYLSDLGSDKVKDVDTKKLESLLLDSIEIILQESNFYAGGLENLLDAVRQLPQKTSPTTVLEANITIERKLPVEKPLTNVEKANQLKWKEEFTKVAYEKYNKGSAASKLADRLVNELPSSIIIQPFNPERLTDMISTLGVGSSIMSKFLYSEDAVVIGCRRFFEQQLKDPNLKSAEWRIFISDSDRENLLPFCFEGIIEAQIKEEIKSGRQIRGGIEITPIVISLLKKIDLRQLPLTVEGQKRLQMLTHQMIDPKFIENKSLLLPSISNSLSNRFKAILRSPTVTAHNVNALNNSKMSSAELGQAFSVSAKSRYSKINMGEVRDAVATNPAGCAKVLAIPVINTLMKGADEETISETQSDVSKFIDGLSKGESAKAFSVKINKFMDKFRV
ncbi:MAG: hypothetical protein H0U49_08115, partial [Parachlamydiaceae bacterium]|nr:hypothetical protein [Parachlamydiaceae bacterium]